jgi:ribose 5-phosphate isomerase B
MKIALGSDHAGFSYKDKLIPELRKKKFDVLDLGIFQASPADYPDVAEKMAEAILLKQAEKGILICGSGVGVSVAANKFPGIRAGICHDCYSARQGVEHDDMNVLCLGSRVLGFELAREIIQAFLQAQFKGHERHMRRTEKIKLFEKKYKKTYPL